MSSNLVIAIYAHSEKDFELSKSQIPFSNQINVVHCDSRTQSRYSFIKNNLNKRILFLDADCEIDGRQLEAIVRKTNPPNVILAGKYQNPINATVLQEAHNFIANGWLQACHNSEINRNTVLGGVFLIFSNSELLFSPTHQQPHFWGAEDKLLAHQMIRHGFLIQIDPELIVTHHTEKNFWPFVRRSWLQGYNDIFSQNGAEKINFKLWLFELQRLNLRLIPAVLVHFSVLQLGKLFRKVLPKHSRLKLK